ncbi:MAG: energy transducer TonB [Myxococcales bacterium]|nr:energy transducer TonB [Myxococcales bacterium]
MAIVDSRRHPRPPSDEEQTIRTLAFSGISVAVHLFAPALLAFMLLGKHQPTTPKPRYIQLQRFERTGKKLSRAQNLRRLQERKKKANVPKKFRGQVVDIAPTPDRTPPKDARFLSEHNTRVRKEMLSRYRRLRYQRPTRHASKSSPNRAARTSPKLAMRSPTQDRRTPGGQRKQRKSAKNKQKGQRRQQTQDKRIALPKRGARNKKRKQRGKGRLARERGKSRYKGRAKRRRLAFGDPELRPEKVQPEQTQSGQGAGQGKSKGRGKGSPPNINLKPSLGTLSQLRGAPAPEHIKDMREGEETLLNSRQWLYATFFNRVKRFVSQHWDPAPVYQRRDPYGNVYGVKDRLTVLQVTLSPDGGLLSAAVHRSSGLAFLDKEAVRAFKAAQPFQNPPKGLRDADGKIRFRFSFFVYNSHRARFSIFR